ncbi:fluoride efflux transporter CrcB [Pontibacillus salicampi]|uniref:Fluoride-specific ion channel FluC n=1 Tax=Pontibacillus salicampi TaxID=1449801 RepID=A0ABV6LNB1_9BACI
MNFLLVALGGGLGSLARYLMGQKWNTGKAQLPVGTWMSNIFGSLLLAILFVLYDKEMIPSHIWYLGGIGFSGAYTTFSTFSKETIHLVENRQYRLALWYVLSSLLIGLATVMIILLLFMDI